MARWMLLVLSLLALACGAEAPARELPGMRLLARVEARLVRERAALRPMLSHYGLVFPVSQGELADFMRQVRVHGEGLDLVLGSEFAPETHGGGLLRLLFDHWRPAGRTPRLDDRYAFQASGVTLALERLYAAARMQLFLPLPGVPPEAAGATLPSSPQLPRMLVHFRLPGGPQRSLESDAYKLLSLLLELEPDPARTWRNRMGQPLSVELLMRHVRDHYLASGAWLSEPPDHSELHLVELLSVFDAARRASELGAVQRHFLEVELAQQDFAASDAGYVLSHYVASLGRLLGAPVSWREDEKQRVRTWLAALEETRFRDVREQRLETLCHLAQGLRLVRARRDRLE